ncbi:thiolase family protein [Pectobacterium sp. A5351]|nr:thiolase family protein [Pectobacterium sp. A5351]WCG82655.1 thiolase family protein [Pectobacterium sp. A5351]
MLNYQPNQDNEPIIVNAYRTPVGRAYGCLSGLSVIDLLVPLIKKLISGSELAPIAVDEVFIGNVTGCNGNIARLAALSAGLPLEVPGVTIDRQCGSGLEAIIQAARFIQAGAGDCYIAGGVESVSTAPWRIEKPSSPKNLPQFYNRSRFSPEEIGDPEMGVAAENVAEKCAITRERQDHFALRSHQRAVSSAINGVFNEEIVPLSVGNQSISADECPRPSTSFEALSSLPSAFVLGGTVTAGNACPLNDGASLVLIMSRKKAREYGYSTGLRFLDSASAGVDPNYLGLGPVASTKKLLSRQPSLQMSMINVIEFNEAFASQVLGSLDALGVDEHKVNRQGGAIALGHPYGASGSILVTRLFSQLIRAPQHQADKQYAMAMLGIAGGLGLTSLFDIAETI